MIPSASSTDMGGPSDNTFHSEKVAFLNTLAPLFPDVSGTEALLRAIESACPQQQQWVERHFAAMQTIYLPLWRSLGPAYVASLSQSIGGDRVPLVVRLESWPETWTGHQEALLELLEKSRLRGEEPDAARNPYIHEGWEWRYEGFFGLLRVTTEDEADWMVAVLAPMHFVRGLAHSVHWYGGHVPSNPSKLTLGMP